MSDDKLTPASRHDLEICLSLGLTAGRSLERSQAVAERLVEHLEKSAS